MKTDLSRCRHPAIEALIIKRNVIWAVMLRDMRTRFFNHGLGFMIVPLWPLVHMAVIITIHSIAAHAPQYGDSSALFYASGIIPTMVFIYLSRFMALSVVTNRAMMAFPIIRPIDVMTGRACLEIIAAFITLTLMFIVLSIVGLDPWPYDIETATEAYLSVLFLGFGIGLLVGTLALIYPLILTAWQLMIICIYISSGTMFVASNYPDSISKWLAYNPVTECVEWMRTAYYQSYSDKLVSPLYVLSFGGIALFLGIMIERIFRRYMLDR